MGYPNDGKSLPPDKAKSDSVLIERIKAGDEAAFKAIYERYQEKLEQYTFLIVKSQFRSKEIVQEVFVKIWINRMKLDASLSFKHFILKITRNLALDHLRKIAREEQLKREHKKDIVRACHHTQNAITFEEYQGTIHKIVQNLPKQKRTIFELWQYEGKSKEEIARRLGISKKTVHNHLWKILQTIKDQLHPHIDITLSVLLVVFFS